MSRRLFRSGALVSGNTLLSRVAGLVRDIIIARVFGASAGVDAFLVAFRLPNLLRRLFAEGAFNQAFVPVLTEYKETRSFAEVREFAASVVGMLGVVLFVVTLLGVLGAPLLVMLFAFGFVGEPDKFDLTVTLLRITFPYILFISLTSFAGSLLNTYGRFGVPAFTPVLLNLVLIAAAIFVSPHLDQPVMALAIGVFVAGAVQLVFQVPFVHRVGLLVKPRFRPRDTGVVRVLKLILPATFGVSVAQVNILVDTLIASFLATGSITWLYYSDRMVEFPLGVFGIALATVILPNLSSEHAQGDTARFSDTLDWALRLMVVIGVPASVGLAVLAGPVLTTLFQYGAFGADDVNMAAMSLWAYSVGLVGFIAIKILAPGFFARQDMRTPVRIGVVAMLANIVLNLLLVVPLAHAGLALATSLSAFINAGLLFWMLRKADVYKPRAGWAKLLGQVLAANAVMAAVLLWLKADPEVWLALGVMARAVDLTTLILAGVACYLCALGLLGVRPRSLLERQRS